MPFVVICIFIFTEPDMIQIIINTQRNNYLNHQRLHLTIKNNKINR